MSRESGAEEEMAKGSVTPLVVVVYVLYTSC